MVVQHFKITATGPCGDTCDPRYVVYFWVKLHDGPAKHVVLDQSAVSSGLVGAQQAVLPLVDQSLLTDAETSEPEALPLNWSEVEVGDIAIIPAGTVKDPGLFALPADAPFSLQSFEANQVPDSALAEVEGVMPLGNQELYKMIGQKYVGTVYDGNINITYRPVSGCLQGERANTIVFTVLNVLVPGSLPGSTSDSLYHLVVRLEPQCAAVETQSVKIQDKEPDTVQITKAEYNPDTQKLTVLATSSYGSSSLMTVSVDGYLMEAPMKYNAKTKRYEYVKQFDPNLKGMKVVISTNRGGSYNTTVK
jgi:hypothetical protein